MPEASESCVSDSSKDLSVLKWWYSVKANWVGQGDCRRHLIGGKVVLLGGAPLRSLQRKLLHAHTVHSDTVKQSDQGIWVTSF